ncbi:MAG: hypothetical protein ABIE42_05770 [Candidatus Eisenbacteria bacterium]
MNNKQTVLDRLINRAPGDVPTYRDLKEGRAWSIWTTERGLWNLRVTRSELLELLASGYDFDAVTTAWANGH